MVLAARPSIQLVQFFRAPAVTYNDNSTVKRRRPRKLTTLLQAGDEL